MPESRPTSGKTIASRDAVSPVRTSESVETTFPRMILQAVRDTNQRLITDPSNVEQIFGYSTDKIIPSFISEAKALIDTYPEDFLGMISKTDDRGSLLLGFGEFSNGGKLLKLQFIKKSPPVGVEPYEWVITQIPLDEKAFAQAPKWPFAGYQDIRKGMNERVNVKKPGEKVTLEEFQLMWKGLRWLSANILDWNKEGQIIYPEDLDRPSTQSPSHQAIED